MKKLSVFILLIIIAVSSVAVYTANHEVYLPFGNSIYGRWEADDSYIHKLEFFSDGTYKSSDANYYGSYSAESGRLRLGGVLMPDKTYTYDIKGKTLTLYFDNGEVFGTYERVN